MAKSTTPTQPLYVWASLRILLGLIFLWAFFDKLLGLGMATPSGKSWMDGASPTLGFLKNASKGPFVDIFHSLAGNTAVDWLFMLGLLGIGVALTFGVAVRLASWAGIALMVLMWAAVLPPANHPFIDDHIVYAVVLYGLTMVPAGEVWGMGKWWAKSSFGKMLGK